MAWLIDDESVRINAQSTWKTLTEKVLLHAKLEAVHNSRLRVLMEQFDIDEECEYILPLKK